MARRRPWPKIADDLLHRAPPSQAEQRAKAAFRVAIAVLVVSAPITALGLYLIALTLPAKLAQLAAVWP